MAPPAKKLKTEEAAAEAKDEEMKGEEVKAETKPAAPEPPKELEVDAPADSKPKVKDPVSFATADTTLNVMSCDANNVLMCLQEGGVQHLLAGARANLGIKSGRYMFECKTVEQLNPQSSAGPKVRSVVRVGLAVAGSSLLLGSEGTCYFDSEGWFHDGTKKMRAGSRFGRDSVVAVLLNLDASSPNANTVSLFVDGKRACQPQALSESLKGKAFFPAVTFRNATVHTNFGPSPLCPLPFKCRMVQDATKTDTVAAKVEAEPADGKYEVVMPVGLPGEGTFDWLDSFMAAHPGYIELSDRMIIEWAEKSGLYRATRGGGKASTDKPEFSFGIKELDDHSIRRIFQTFASLQSRNYVVMELKDNLIKESRAMSLSKFGDGFKKVAHVVVGEPSPAFKKKTQEQTLKAKQAASDVAFRAKKAEEKRKKMIEKKQKEAEKARKKAEKVKAKALKQAQEALKKKIEEKKKAAEKKEGDEEAKEEEKEEKKEEPEEDEEEEEEDVEEEQEDTEEPPKVELDDEEKKLWYRKTAVPDVSSYVLSTSFSKFTLPEKDEGFDEIKYEWTKEAKVADYLKNWILDRKISLKIEDLKPSAWFHNQCRKFQYAVQKWHAKQNEYKSKLAKKAADKAKKEAAAKAAAAKKAAEEAKKAKAAKEAEEKGEKPKEEENKEEEPAPMEVEEEDPEDEVDFDGVDIFGVEDVCDLGGGMPLFKDFIYEDWAMMSLHFELHLLAHAFAKDVNDPDRPGILLEHLPFYFNMYYKKQLSPRAFGVETVKDVVDMAADAVKATDKGTLESLLAEDMESLHVFVQMTEEARRFRKYKLDLGEESAKLKLQAGAHQMTSPVTGGPQKKFFGQAGIASMKGKGKGLRYSPYAALAPGRKGAGKGA